MADEPKADELQRLRRNVQQLTARNRRLQKSLGDRHGELQGDRNVRNLSERVPASQTTARLAAIVEATRDAILSTDGQGTIESWNTGAERMFGYSAEEALGKPISILSSADGVQQQRQVFARLKRGEHITDLETVRIHKDGRPVHVSMNLSPIHDSAGVLVGTAAIARDISARQRGEAALRESEQRFRTIFEQAAVGVALLETRSGRFVRINQKYSGLIGYGQEEMLQKTFMDVTYPDDLEGDLQNMRRLHRGDIREFSMEKRLLRKDGSSVWVHLTVSPTWEPGEEPSHHIAIVKDITERRRIEQVVRDSEHKYRQLIETTQEGVWVIDAEARTTFVNERMAALLQYTVDEMLGCIVFDFMDATARQEAMLHLPRYKQGVREQHDFRLQRKDGTDLWVSMSTNPLTHEDGHYVGALAMVSDITSRKQAEAELKLAHDQLEARVRERTSELIAANRRLESEVAARQRVDEERERLISVIEATTDFVGFAEPDGRICYLNQAARQELGIPRDLDLTQLYIWDCQPAWSSDPMLKEGLAVASQQGLWKGELSWLAPDGKEIPLSVLLHVHRSSDGEIDLISAIARDITDLKEAEQALLRAERLASVGTLAAGIAHEINNPLGAMLLTTEYALRKTDEPRVVDESLQRILSQVERCARIVRSVLQFSRDGRSQKWTNDLREVVLRARDETRQLAQQTDAVVEVHASAPNCHVELNPLEMEQVFINLMANAIQASERRGRIDVKVDATADAVRAVVEDHGKGIDARQLSRIFDPFYTTRQHVGGTGLGLSIVHGIVRDHGGSIDVRSRPGEGTCVSVVFPRAKVEGSPSHA